MKKSENVQKSDLIKAFGEVIDKNTSSKEDLCNLILALQDCFSFLHGERYKFRDDISFYIRATRNDLKNRPEHIIGLYDNMTDSLSEMLLLAGRSAEGLKIVHAMKDDLEEIVDLCNE